MMVPTEVTRLEELSEEILDWIFKKNPSTATFVGINGYDDELEDKNIEKIQEELDQAKDYQIKLGFISKDFLPLDKQIDFQLLDSMLQDIARDIEKIRTYEQDPGLYLNLAIESVYLLIIRDYRPFDDRMRSILSRMKQIPRLFEAAKEQIHNPPQVFIKTAKLNLTGAKTFFGQVIPQTAEHVPELKKEILAEAENIGDVLTDFEDFLTDLEETATGNYAVGKEIFDELLQEHHFLSHDAESLMEKGKELVEDTHKELQQLARQIDANKTWQELIEETKQEHPSEEELLDFYKQECDKVKQFVIDNEIVNIPEKEELVIEETPEYMRTLIPYAAYLQPGPFDSSQVGRFWVTPVNPNKSEQEKQALLGEHNKYSVPVTTLHEGYPGHHLQLCHANKAPSKIKKLASSTLFAEGWAFYCEELMEELGYIQDPKTKLNRLKDQAWRASRIVVDVGLHTEKMTFQEAVDYMVENALLEKDSAITEVRRYTQSPTQPMSYLMGKIEIMKLVNVYREKLGDSYKLKDFHNELLSHGTIPPALLRKLLLTEEV